MNILYYNDIDNSRVKKQYSKTVGFLENNDFVSAEIKKISNSGYYRAKLDYENRLLFKFAKYNGQTYVLLLEVIYNHEYEKSRFLRGAKIDENRLVARGYGESQLLLSDDEINKLPTEEARESAHQGNRRTELKVTEYNKIEEPEEDEELDGELEELQVEERVDPTGKDLEDKIDWDN